MSYGLFNSPTIPSDSLSESIVVDIKGFSEFRNGIYNIFIGNVVIALSIIGLLFRRSPSAIRRLIVSVIIDPINTMLAGWSFIHVSKETGERFAPFFTDGNAFATITRVCRIIGIAASLNDIKPGNVFWRSCTV